MENIKATKRLPVSDTSLMAYLPSLVLLGLLTFLALIFTVARSTSSGNVKVPAPIRELMEQIQDKSPDEVTSIIHKRFGRGHDEGSGIITEVWRVDGGILALSDYEGPTYDKAGKRIWLMKTAHYLGANLVGSYELVSLPTKQDNGGNWLGDLEIRANHSYHFALPHEKDTGSEMDQIVDKSWRKYFLRFHPTGKVSVRYVGHMNGATILENVPDETKVAEIKFVSTDGHQAMFDVTSNAFYRVLTLGNAQTRAFRMSKEWYNIWWRGPNDSHWRPVR